MGVIYKAVSTSGRAYVGQTTKTAEERWKEHCIEARNPKIRGCRKLNNAIRKYGGDSFVLTTLETGVKDEELDEHEIHHIAFENSMHPHGYNLTAGGGGNRDPSSETRALNSKAKKAQWSDPSTRKNMERCHSDEANQKRVDTCEVKRKRKVDASSSEDAVKIHKKYEKSQKKRFRDLEMRQSLRDPDKAEEWHRNNNAMTPDDRKRQTCFQQRMEQIEKLPILDGHHKMLKLKTVALAMAKMKGVPQSNIEQWYPNMLTGAEITALRKNGGVWPGSVPAPPASCLSRPFGGARHSRRSATTRDDQHRPEAQAGGCWQTKQLTAETRG